MPIWVDPTAKIPYVLKADREKSEAEQVRFLFRVMTARDYASFTDTLRTDDNDKVENWAEYNFALLRFTLVGWDGPGAPPFEVDEHGHPTDETLTRIPYEDRWELARAADKANKVSDEDVGKSPAP